MREILYRAKRLADGKWICGYYFEQDMADGMRSYIRTLQADRFGTDFAVDPATVGQYTGLTDKNGNKIFEGDIIDFTNVDYPDCEIIFDNGSFVCNEIGEDNIICELRLGLVNEVIGNIYELLEGGKK